MLSQSREPKPKMVAPFPFPPFSSIVRSLSQKKMEEEVVLRDSCGVFGCVSSAEGAKQVKVFETVYLGLVALQHRGQESSGIVVSEGDKFHIKKGMGLVSNVYNDNDEVFDGSIAIGHNRYSTAGSSSISNCQPFVVHTAYGQIAVAHNGQLVNASSVRRSLLKQGVGLSTESDSELITQMLVSEPPYGELKGVNWLERIKHMMTRIQCSYSVVLLTSKQEIYAFRGPHGNRPLCIGEIDIPLPPSNDISTKKPRDTSTMFIVSSESCAFASIGATLMRDVAPGEIIRLTQDGVESLHKVSLPSKKTSSFCIFEYVYFARADTVFDGQMVHAIRKESGKQLAIEWPVDADIVSTIPDSANPAAKGFSQQSGIPYEDVVVKNRYVGRTFIQPHFRKKGVLTKFGPLKDNIRGKRIVLIDDSIVRGNTMPRIVELLKNNGAKEVHIRVASPPLKHPCFMGINIPTSDELIANKFSPEELAQKFGADTLKYLSIEGLKLSVEKGIEDKSIGHCTACLSGNYPTELDW